MSSQLHHGKVALADRPFDIVKSDADLLFTLCRSSIHVYVNFSFNLLQRFYEFTLPSDLFANLQQSERAAIKVMPQFLFLVSNSFIIMVL